MSPTAHERLARALAGEAVDRVPAWLMRQAGRYLPEYREVRARVSFLELCRDADLACEVTIQPLDRFPLDAAIVFSDILTVPEALGQPVEFTAGHGPVLADPVRDRAGIAALRRGQGHLPVAAETIRRFRAARPEVPILGFAGAPLTLLFYMVEGSGSRDWVHAKRFLYADPEAARQLLDLLADVVGEHLQAQVEAGAAAVQLFDTWAGALPAEDVRRFALPAAARALSHVRGAPRIYFAKDAAPFVASLPEVGAEAYGVDGRMDLAEARRALGDLPVQGNLDPVLLHAPRDTIVARTRAVLEAGGGRGHVFNLGHGLLPTTPIEGVQAMLETVRAWRPPGAA
ncbi:MAG: uroporphyrinogen decarboxylase [Alphaproteobacteria bacterium]|nr:uroporphyrinogen decarboxylase [Alphaproteobacteria bacterium]